MKILDTVSIIVCAAVVALLPACSHSSNSGEPLSQTMITPPSVSASAPADLPGLHNVVAYGEGLYSGSAPDGGIAFDTIRGMGITTVISVDGARPDVGAARARGIRYIHLPIGYNGMTTERTLEIAQAVRGAEGPVYIHCHHGKHRSAGAAGAAAVTLGRMDNLEAETRMKVSGTSPGYPGLYACVANARPAKSGDFRRVRSDFPEVWKTTGMVSAMVEIGHAMEHLNAIETAGWRTPAESPDLVPAAEAGHLADLLRTLQDDPDTKKHPEEFTEWLVSSSGDAARLEEAILAGAPTVRLSELLKPVAQSCKDCHMKYRDQ